MLAWSYVELSGSKTWTEFGYEVGAAPVGVVPALLRICRSTYVSYQACLMVALSPSWCMIRLCRLSTRSASPSWHHSCRSTNRHCNSTSVLLWRLENKKQVFSTARHCGSLITEQHTDSVNFTPLTAHLVPSHWRWKPDFLPGLCRTSWHPASPYCHFLPQICSTVEIRNCLC